jgi:DNA-binding transcriptional LysR family regulator
VLTLIIGYLIKVTMGLRVSEEDEVNGIDEAEHAESAYEFSGLRSGSSSISKAADALFTLGSDIKVASVKYQIIYREEHAVFCGSTHPLSHRKERAITSAECYDHPWVLRGYWSGIRRHRFDNAAANRVTFDIEAQLLMVLSGAYLGVLPTHFASLFEQQGRLRRLPLADEAYFADIEVATRAGEQATNVVYVRDTIIKAHQMHLQKSMYRFSE